MKRKGWTLFTQDDIEDYDDDRLCSNEQRKECERDDCCYMVCGTGGGYVDKTRFKKLDARQRAVVKSNMLGCRRVLLKKKPEKDGGENMLVEVDEPTDHNMRIIGKIMLELQTACTCHGNAKTIAVDCIACNALELLKIWVEGKFDSHEEAAQQLGVDEEDLRAHH